MSRSEYIRKVVAEALANEGFTQAWYYARRPVMTTKEKDTNDRYPRPNYGLQHLAVVVLAKGITWQLADRIHVLVKGERRRVRRSHRHSRPKSVCCRRNYSVT